MKRAALLIVIAGLALAQDRPSVIWATSSGALSAAVTADVLTSWHHRELDPLCASPDGTFGVKGAAIRLSTASAAILIERLVIRRWPRTQRLFSVINFGSAASSGLTAYQNSQVRYR